MRVIAGEAEQAGENAPQHYQEVAVTAKKRESTTVLITPISVTTVSSFEIQEHGLAGLNLLLQSDPVGQ